MNPNVIEENPEKYVGLGINNLPPDITESEILKFLKDEVHEDLEMVKDLDSISARGAETIFSSTRMRSACILQT